MANALKDYVEKYLLNPGSTFSNVDEDGQEIEDGQVVDKVLGAEGVSDTPELASKLRIRNSALLADYNPKYRGEKISRSNLHKQTTPDYDDNLAKLCMVEEDVEEDIKLGTNNSNKECSKKQVIRQQNNVEEDNLINGQLGNSSDEDLEYSKYENSDDDDGSGIDDDDADGSDVDDDDGSNIDGSDDENTDSPTVKKPASNFKQFNVAGEEELLKARAIDRQLVLFDSLFASRITMQTLLSNNKQLPQCDAYKQFEQLGDPHYNTGLSKAKKHIGRLMTSLDELQCLLLSSNSGTKSILTGVVNTNSDEEITSNDEEDPTLNVVTKEKSNVDRKRKRSVNDYGKHLEKRFAAFIPHRNDIYTKWYDKTKALSAQRSDNKFAAFEVSALQQLNTVLANKEQLIRRTQLLSTARGNTARTLGKIPSSKTDLNEIYDPEVFDDTDFYRKMLEDVLKAKVSLSDNMIDVSRKWIEIQNLRRKVKKNVDTKASKGRKIRYEIMSKMQQSLAPSRPSKMDDSAINILFGSLFGKALH